MTSSIKFILATLLVILNITGCMRHKPHDAKIDAKLFFGDDADFDINAAGGNLVPNQTKFQSIKGWNIPTYQTFVFWVELKDFSTNSLRDFPFAVLDENDNEICEVLDTLDGKPICKYRANASSRIVWKERIPYDHYKSKAEPVRIIRKIKGLGARRGIRTAVFEINPWANSRKNLVDVRHVTFELTKDDAEILKDKNYNSQRQLKFDNATDSSELVIRSITKQFYNSVEPMIVDRSDPNLEKLENDYSSNNLIFSKYEPSEFYKRRKATGLNNNDEVEFLSELEHTENKVYVYRQSDQRFPKIDGVKFDFTVYMLLGFRYPNLTDGYSISEISAGRFQVIAHLVLEPEDGTAPILLTPGIKPIVSEIKRNNDLQLNYKTIVPYYPSSGLIKLAIRIRPLGVRQGLTPVDRLFTVGTFNRLIGKDGSLLEDEISRNDQFNFNDYISSVMNGKEAYKAGLVDKAREFQVNDMSIRFSTVEAGETAAQRTVIFKVETDVLDETTGVPVGDNVPFEVVSLHRDYTDPNNKAKWKFVKITNAEDAKSPSRSRRGKINWYDTITHKYYQTEELVERDIFIAKWKPNFDLKDVIEKWSLTVGEDLTQTQPPSGVQRLRIYLNPWDEKFGTFGVDANIASESFLEKVRGREKIPSRFFIGDFGYETLRFRYKIDKDMKLNVKKTVLLNIKPLVLRYSSILEGINSIYNLRDGIYLMKTALQKDYLDPSARNEKDILQIPFKLENDSGALLTQDYDPNDMKGIPNLEINAPNGDSQVYYNNQKVANQFDQSGNPVAGAVSIPYGDPRRKRAMSMVKKLVRVNAGRVITPVEFSIEDLRLMRIRQQFFVQMEPVNQIRLQMINLVKERFEKIFQIKTGENSPILDKMTANEQARLKSLMTSVLDAVALAVTDDVYVTKIEDLENIVNDPTVADAISAFERAKFGGQSIDMRLKDILRSIKAEADKKDEVLNITDEDVSKRQDEVDAELAKKRELHDNNLKAVQELDQANTASENKNKVYEQQCEKLNPVEVYLDESKKMTSQSENIDAVTKALIPFDTGVFADDYSDIVSKYRPFQEGGKQFFENLANQQTLNKILTNDFTLSPAFGAVSNLDMLIDRKSGIKGRTFVGPMTFLYNTNKGSLRPTDNLDESYCETDDCNSINTSIDSQYGEIQNFGYEKSPYHGSIAHFQNVTFDDQEFVDTKTGLVTKIKGLETMFNELQNDKKVRRRVDTLLTRFLDYYDMSYVSLTDQSIDRLVCTNDISPSGSCYQKDHEKTVKLNDFISEYSNTVNEVVNLDYQNSSNIEFKYQKIEYSPRTKNKLQDYHRPSAISIPWGFISPKYEVGLDRCSLNLKNSDLSAVCSDSNAQKRLGGWLGTSYETEAVYVPPTSKELENIIRYPFKGHQMVGAGAAQFDAVVESKMCDLLVYGEIARKASARVKTEQDKLELRKEVFDLARRCQTDVQNGLHPIAIERKFRIFETGRYYFLGGKSMNINASQDVKVSTGLRASRSFGARPLRLVTGVIERGRSFISNVFGLVMGSFDLTYNLVRDRTYGEGTGISKGTYLVMQSAEFEVELTSFEQCLSIRWSPDFVEKYKKAVNFTDGKFSDYYILGLYLCSGVKENTPVAVNEKYYYFTQHFTEGDMLDPADIHNHPWLLSLRGVREFSAFMLSLQSYEKTGTDTYDPEFVSAEELVGYFDYMNSDRINILKRLNGDPNPTSHYPVTHRQDWPIKQMINTYKRVLPTFPGVYTQLDEENYYDRSWPWASGEPGSVMEESKRCVQ